MAAYSKMSLPANTTRHVTKLDRTQVEQWLSNYVYRNTSVIARRELPTPELAPDPITIAVLDPISLRITLFRKSELIDIQLASLATINPTSHVVHRYLNSARNVAGVKPAILISQQEPGAYLAFRPLSLRANKESWPSHIEDELIRGVFSGPIREPFQDIEGARLTPDVITISDGSWGKDSGRYTARVSVYDFSNNTAYLLVAQHDTRPSRYSRKERKDAA